jgi:hypothetical protein
LYFKIFAYKLQPLVCPGWPILSAEKQIHIPIRVSHSKEVEVRRLMIRSEKTKGESQIRGRQIVADGEEIGRSVLRWERPLRPRKR